MSIHEIEIILAWLAYISHIQTIDVSRKSQVTKNISNKFAKSITKSILKNKYLTIKSNYKKLLISVIEIQYWS